MQWYMSALYVTFIQLSQSLPFIVHSCESPGVLQTLQKPSLVCSVYTIVWPCVFEVRLIEIFWKEDVCLSPLFFFLTSSLDHYIDILAVSYQQKLIVRKHYSESCKDWLLYLGGQKPHTEQRMQNKKNKRAVHWKRHFSLCINMLIKWKQRLYMKMSLYYFSIILLS